VPLFENPMLFSKTRIHKQTVILKQTMKTHINTRIFKHKFWKK